MLLNALFMLAIVLMSSLWIPHAQAGAPSPYFHVCSSVILYSNPSGALDLSESVIDLFGGANNSGYGSQYPGPFPAPYGGQGQNQPMDLVFPQSEVAFYANFTNNGLPVISTDVILKIEGPYERLANGTLVKKNSWRTWAELTVVTNGSGIAKCIYKMPWNDFSPDSYIGIWSTTASALVSGVEVIDSMIFYYEYSVYITSVVTDAYLYRPVQDVLVSVEYMTHAAQYYPVCFVTELKNASEETFRSQYFVEMFGGAPFGIWKHYQFVISCFIPFITGAVGYAYIYVNCYDKHPALGGFALCPQYMPLPEIFIADIVVPDDHSTIQEAINAVWGYTGRKWAIYVRKGTYNENVVVNWTVNMVGEDSATTIIDGGGLENVTTISANDVTMENFKITDSDGGSTGIFIDSCNNTNLQNNNVANNDLGLYVRFSSNNYVYHNKFVNNTQQVLTYNSTIMWDDGYPSGGNYWSDYTGADSYSGPYQNETGNDGIGDTPYVIDANNMDNYPLMKPWPTRIVETTVEIAGENYTITIESNAAITYAVATKNALGFTTSSVTRTIGYINVTFPMVLNTTQIKVFIDGVELTPPPFPIIKSNGTHYFIYFEFAQSTHNITMQYAIADVATTNITPAKTIVGQGYTIRINTTIQNQGDYEETFNVTVYANTTSIATQTVTLTSGNSTSITFTWNTTGFAKGNYTIKAIADTVQGEIDTTDNELIDGWVYVGLVGDVNVDGIVDIEDIYLIALAYGTMPGQPGYNPNLDINSDDIIDIADIYIAALHYGETDP
jgi:parallel beta-helix repeat protein